MLAWQNPCTAVTQLVPVHNPNCLTVVLPFILKRQELRNRKCPITRANKPSSNVTSDKMAGICTIAGLQFYDLGLSSYMGTN